VFTPLNESHNLSAIDPTDLKTILNHDVLTEQQFRKCGCFYTPLLQRGVHLKGTEGITGCWRVSVCHRYGNSLLDGSFAYSLHRFLPRPRRVEYWPVGLRARRNGPCFPLTRPFACVPARFWDALGLFDLPLANVSLFARSAFPVLPTSKYSASKHTSIWRHSLMAHPFTMIRVDNSSRSGIIRDVHGWNLSRVVQRGLCHSLQANGH
jgi:hypothetical protein